MTEYPIQVTPTVTCKSDVNEEVIFVMQHTLRHVI